LSDYVGKEAGAAPADFGFRPGSNLGGPLVLYGSQYPGGKAFNPAAFTPPPTGQQGDFGRNVLRSFGAWQADVAFQRQFRLTEKMGLRFRASSSTSSTTRTLAFSTTSNLGHCSASQRRR